MVITTEKTAQQIREIVADATLPNEMTDGFEESEAFAPAKLMRTYRTRAYFSKAGHIRLDEVFDQQVLLYNAAIEERKTAWQYGRNKITYTVQSRELTAVRQDFPQIEGLVDRRVQVGTLRRLHKAFGAFFRRVKTGDTPGYPRFKSRRRWKTVEVYSGASRYMRYDADRGKGVVVVKGLPMRFKDKRIPVGMQPLEIRISRRPNGVYLYFVFDHLRASPAIESPQHPIGINAGRSGVRWGLSDGSLIDRRRVDDRRKRRLQRKIAQQKLGSNSRRKTVASTLADAGLAPLYPFGATNAARGVSYCPTVQSRAVAWLTQRSPTRPSRPPHRLAHLWGLCNIQAVPVGASVPCGAVELRCALRCIWAHWWPVGTTRCYATSTSGC